MPRLSHELACEPKYEIAFCADAHAQIYIQVSFTSRMIDRLVGGAAVPTSCDCPGGVLTCFPLSGQSDSSKFHNSGHNRKELFLSSRARQWLIRALSFPRASSLFLIRATFTFCSCKSDIQKSCWSRHTYHPTNQSNASTINTPTFRDGSEAPFQRSLRRAGLGQ